MPHIQNGKHPLLIIDCYGFVYRAYHANPKLTNPQGEEVGAIYGFTNMLIKLLTRFHPQKVVAIFDDGGTNFRHQLYKDYKIHRPPAPEDLKSQFPHLKEVAQALNILTYSQSGYEADDVIASIARKFCATQPVVIFSSDKDLLQLVDNQILIFNPSTESLVGKSEVQEKFGVVPSKMRDYLALVGDASDNVPGVKGIGAKGAVALLEKFSSLSAILEHTEELTPKQKILLENGKESGELSLKLVTLVSDIAIPFTLEELDWKPPHRDQIMNFLQKYNFQSLIKRANNLYDTSSLYQGANNDFNGANTNVLDNPVKNTVVTNEEELEQHLQQSLSLGYLSFFLEKKPTLRIHFSNCAGTSFLINQDHFSAKIMQLITQYLADESIIKITYDLKSTLNHIPEFAKEISCAHDLMLMHYALDTIHSKGTTLQQIISTLRGKTTNCNNTYLVTLFYEAYVQLQKSLLREKSLHIYHDLDLPLAKILHNMEQEGILVNENKILSISKNLGIKIQALEKRIFQFCGTTFNLSSPKQLADVLFNSLGIPYVRKLSKSKTYSTDVSSLEYLERSGFAIARLILEWRHLNKLKTTYADALPKQINCKTRRIHTTFSQVSTQTGRLSSITPNLQNIPTRSEEEQDIRSAFIAPEGHKIVSADYSQIELRILSHIAQISSMRQAFLNDDDVHLKTASEIFKLPIPDLSLDHRKKAKTINFGIIYGSTSFGIAKQLNVNHKEAQFYIDSYFEQYPEILWYMNNTKKHAHISGYVLSLFGRKCSIENINDSNHSVRTAAERAAINAPIQASASDIMRLAMIKVQKLIIKESLPCKLLLQIHDELLFECENAAVLDLSQMLKKVMENIVSISVPLPVNIAVKSHW